MSHSDESTADPKKIGGAFLLLLSLLLGLWLLDSRINQANQRLLCLIDLRIQEGIAYEEWEASEPLPQSCRL